MAVINNVFYIIMLITALVLAVVFTIKRSNHADETGLLLKTMASIAFIFLGIVSFRGSAGAKTVFAIPGLIMGLTGDIYLDMKFVYPKSDTIYTFTGFGAFILGHIFYFIFLVRQYGLFGTGLIVALIVGIIAGIGIYLTPGLMKLDYGMFRVISSLYAALLVFITVYAGSLCFSAFTTAKLLFFIGIVLFLISDLILSQIYFGNDRNTPAAAISNHATYYLGQIFIAASIFWI